MPEPNNDQNEELLRLRTTNADLLAKKQSYKTRIAELETANSDLATKLDARDAELRTIKVETPLRELAGEMSNLPELFAEKLQKHYDIQAIDGSLQLLSKDGKQVVDASGNPITLDKPSLTKLLLADKHPDSAIFKTIVIVSRATGGAGAPRSNGLPISPGSGANKQQPGIEFGLR